jgi:hypothetical protein
MSFKRKWLKKSNVLFAINFHTNLWNVDHAINYSVNIAKCNLPSTITRKRNMLITIFPTEVAGGEELVELLITKWLLQEEVAEINNLSLH